MATFNGSNATKRYSAPSEKVAVKEQGGRMRAAYDKLDSSVTGALLANDVVRMGVIPKGAKVYDAYADVTNSFTTGVANIGWAAGAAGTEAADADGFFAAVDLTTAARLRMPFGAAGLYKEFAEEVDVQMTITTGASNDGVAHVTVVYALD